MRDMAEHEIDTEERRFAYLAAEKKAHHGGQCGGRGCCWFCELDAKTVAKPDSV